MSQPPDDGSLSTSQIGGAGGAGNATEEQLQSLRRAFVTAMRHLANADVLPIDEHGNVVADAESIPDPQELLDGVDLQLETALLLLRSQVLGKSIGRTSVMLEPEGIAGS